jgi:hypothetical protein
MSDTPRDDRKVIACNYDSGRRAVAQGALAYVLPQLGGNLPERVRVLVRSRGGRWIEKWENVRRLVNFRLKTLPPEHPRYADERTHPRAQVTEEHVRLLVECRAELLARVHQERDHPG